MRPAAASIADRCFPVNAEFSTIRARSIDADSKGARPVPARDKRAMLYALSLLLDCLALLGGYVVALTVRDAQFLDAAGQALPVIAIPVFIALAIAGEAQSIETLERRTLGIQRALLALGATAIALLLLTFLLKIEDISRLGFGVTFASASLLIVAERFVLDLIFKATMHGSASAELLLLDGAAANRPCREICNQLL